MRAEETTNGFGWDHVLKEAERIANGFGNLAKPVIAADKPALERLAAASGICLHHIDLEQTNLFFCGYPFTAEHTTRFILPLYGAWIAAAVGLWPTQWSRRNARTLFCWVLTAGATWFLQAVWFVFFLALSAAARIPADLVVTLRQKKQL